MSVLKASRFICVSGLSKLPEHFELIAFRHTALCVYLGYVVVGGIRIHADHEIDFLQAREMARRDEKAQTWNNLLSFANMCSGM